MNEMNEKQNIRSKKQGGKFIPTLCVILGILILASVILTCLPLTVPRLFGIKVLRAESPDMSPELPQNSAVYVTETIPDEIAPGEVIAVSAEDTTEVRRVVQNRIADGAFITKRDANGENDPDPVPYENLEGSVQAHIPFIGRFIPVYSSGVGIIYVILFAASGIILFFLAGRLRPKKAHTVYPDDVDPETGKPLNKRVRRLKLVFAVILLAVFLFSGSVVFYYNGRYQAGRSAYSDAADRYTSVRDAEEGGASDDTGNLTPELPPITVDFSALREFNPDVIGWIYCPDTPINYPVLQGKTNDTYLRHGLDGSYLISGAIFIDSKNSPDFTDANTVIYGHNMKDDSMFSCLENWADQAWYAEHPEIWLLTPERDYRIDLISGHLTDARSDCYQTVILDRDGYVSQALSQSDFGYSHSIIKGKLVLLSTCANESDQARYVLHGVLVPVTAE